MHECLTPLVRISAKTDPTQMLVSHISLNFDGRCRGYAPFVELIKGYRSMPIFSKALVSIRKM